MTSIKNPRLYGGISLGLFLLVMVGLLGVFSYEPTEKATMEEVRVLSYHVGIGRGDRNYFRVASTSTGQFWEIDAAGSPFSADYRGLAVLSISRGRWTGKDHLRLLDESKQ